MDSERGFCAAGVLLVAVRARKTIDKVLAILWPGAAPADVLTGDW